VIVSRMVKNIGVLKRTRTDLYLLWNNQNALLRAIHDAWIKNLNTKIKMEKKALSTDRWRDDQIWMKKFKF